MVLGIMRNLNCLFFVRFPLGYFTPTFCHLPHVERSWAHSSLSIRRGSHQLAVYTCPGILLFFSGGKVLDASPLTKLKLIIMRKYNFGEHITPSNHSEVQHSSQWLCDIMLVLLSMQGRRAGGTIQICVTRWKFLSLVRDWGSGSSICTEEPKHLDMKRSERLYNIFN